MAEKTEIAVEASGFDKVITSINSTTAASKELGEQFKKALLGEVLVQSINKVGQAIGGVKGAAIGASASIAQGFFAGGPVGAALAATGAAVGFIADEFGRADAAAKSSRKALEDAWSLQRLVASGEFFGADAFRPERTGEGERLAKEEEARQSAAQSAFRARNALAIKALDEADAVLEKHFQDELDLEAEQAEALRSAEQEGRAARYSEWQQDIRDFDAAQAVEREQDLEIVRQHAEAKKNAEVREERLKQEELKRQRMEAMDVIRAGARAAESSVLGTVAAITQLDAAQIAAAASSDDFGASVAAAALRAGSGVLQAVAQEATAKALLNLAEGISTGAPNKFASAATYGAAAVAAGAGAVALNTAASAVAPPAAARAPSQAQGGGGGGQRNGDGGGGRTVVVNFQGGALATRDDVGLAIKEALKRDRRYV